MKARTRHTRSTVIDSDDSQSDSDGSEARENGFFDDEALESAESTEDSDSEEEEIDPFPFTQLPPELRLRVWTLFCPDLLGAPRVLDFNVHDSLSPTRKSPCRVVGAGMCLEDQTRPLRCVFATNQQSRAIAKERFPDELRLESDDGEEFTLCVNLQTDIAMLDRVPDFAQEESVLGLPATRVNLDGFSQSLVSLALPLHDANLYEQNTDVTSWLRKFRSLQRIFLYSDEDSYGGRRLKDDAVRWCAAPHASQYYMETFEKEPGYGENYTKLVCWPDAIKSPLFMKAHVPNWHTKFLFKNQENAFDEAEVALHPMVVFQTEQGLDRYDQFVATDYLPLKVFDATEDDSEAESYEEDPDEDYQVNDASEVVDAYESDGIDDDEPEIFHESGDEHLDDGDSEDDGAANPFSSPEASDDGRGPSVRGRKRRVIADSDDEEEDEPSTRPAKRKRVQIIQDSDEDDGADEAASAQVISSDEDEGPTKRRKVQVIDSGESKEEEEEEEEEDDESEEEDQPRHPKLADRLQIRSRHRPVLSDEDDSEEEEEGEDEEEDDDEEDEDEDEDGNGFIDNMAADSDEDEEDEEDEDDE